MFRIRAKLLMPVTTMALASFLLASPGFAGFDNQFEIGSTPREVTEGDMAGHSRRQVKDSNKKKKGREKQGKQTKMTKTKDTEGERNYTAKGKQSKKKNRRERRMEKLEEEQLLNQLNSVQ